MPLCFSRHGARSVVTAAALIWISSCGPEPAVPPPRPDPSLERCSAQLTERACFAAGCHYYTNAIELLEGSSSSRCERGAALGGACLYAPDNEGAPDTLTFYQRRDQDGARQIMQLNVDVDVSGWTRCGPLNAPPDCDCDGRLDP